MSITETTLTNKAENGSSQAANLPRKGTFTDDLHQLVDDFARDAMSHTQVKKNGKQNSQGFDVSSTNHISLLLAVMSLLSDCNHYELVNLMYL